MGGETCHYRLGQMVTIIGSWKFYPKICKVNHFFAQMFCEFAWFCENFNIFYVPLVVQISIFCKLCKKAEKSWNLKTLKNYGPFRIPHPQICENIGFYRLFYKFSMHYILFAFLRTENGVFIKKKYVK